MTPMTTSPVFPRTRIAASRPSPTCLDGHMRHEDHLGNRGDLGPGGVQWMTAGRGIIHSEMPQQSAGRMRASSCGSTFRRRTRCSRELSDIPPGEIPSVKLPGGGRCGDRRDDRDDGIAANGPVNGSGGQTWHRSTVPRRRASAGRRAVHRALASGAAISLCVRRQRRVGAAGQDHALPHRAAGILSDGDQVRLLAGADGVRSCCCRPSRCASPWCIRTLRDEHPRGNRAASPTIATGAWPPAVTTRHRRAARPAAP